MTKYSLEMKIQIFNDDEGVCIEVRQWPDFPDDLIEIHTKANKESIDFYGTQSITIDHTQTKFLIEALTKIMNHQKEHKYDS